MHQSVPKTLYATSFCLYDRFPQTTMDKGHTTKDTFEVKNKLKKKIDL